MKTEITVGLCVKNSERTIGEVLESIINQGYPHELMEIVIVDGCSRDRTVSIVNSLISRTGMQARVYSDEGKGLGFARQMVVDHSAGRYILFVDGDVKLLDGFVQEQVQFMDARPKVGIAVGRYTYHEGHSLTSRLWSLYHQIQSMNFVGADASICRPEVIREAGGFDRNIRGACEDLEIIARIQANGWLYRVNPNAKFQHDRRHDLREFLAEHVWYGYGEHYLSHKHRDDYRRGHNAPFQTSVHRLKLAGEAYQFSHQKTSFLMPMLLTLGSLARWAGFIKAHLDRYGHKIDSCNKYD